jgi:hypothetical protein
LGNPCWNIPLHCHNSPTMEPESKAMSLYVFYEYNSTCENSTWVYCTQNFNPEDPAHGVKMTTPPQKLIIHGLCYSICRLLHSKLSRCLFTLTIAFALENQTTWHKLYWCVHGQGWDDWTDVTARGHSPHSPATTAQSQCISFVGFWGLNECM